MADAHYRRVTLSNWKKLPPEVFYKTVVLKNFAIFMGKYLCEIFKKTYFEKNLRMAASELALQSDCLELCFWIAFKTISTKWYYKNTGRFQKRALNKIWHIYKLSMLSCKPSFSMFSINNYYTKRKPLQSSDTLLKDVIVYRCVLFVVVITTAQLHSTKSEFRFYTGSNPACVVSACRRFAMVKISDNGPSWK